MRPIIWMLAAVFMALASVANAELFSGGDAVNFELPNGMKVILLENHKAPVVAFQAWVNVGSSDEGPGTYGMAHVHEHMLFKGTQKRGVGEIARDVEGAGGDINAWTSFDQTVYHLVLASRFFDTGLDILADALRSSTFDPDELKRELQVVLEEIRRGNDMPSRRISEDLFELAYAKHPYGRPIIGYDKVVEKFTREQILDFYHRWYAPNNMTFVVVGDFDAKKAKAKIRKAFAGFKKEKLPKRHNITEPEQKSMRAKLLRQNVQETHFTFAFHIPDIKSEDMPALDLLSMVLSHGESSRLNQRIKEEQGLVNGISAYSYSPRDAGLFIVQAALNDQKIEKALTNSVQEVVRTRYEPVSHEELRRAKINIISEAVYEKETVEGQARKLGFYQTVLGDLSWEKQYYDRIEAVTPADIQRVADKYFRPDNVTVVGLLPDHVQKDVKADRLKSWVMAGFKRAAEGGKQKHRAGEVETLTLKNGVRLVLKENHDLPVLSVKAVSLGGILYETKETNGLSNMVARVWTKGTPDKSAFVIAKSIESMAGSLDAISGRNSLGLSMEVLSQFTDEGMHLLVDVLRHPTFDDKELEIERRNVLEYLRSLEDNLSAFVFKNFMKELCGDHPYSMHVAGTKENVERFKRADLQSFYERIVKPDNLVISIVGDFNSKHMKDVLERELGDWHPVPFQRITAQPLQAVTNARSSEVFRKKEQAHLVYGFIGPALTSEDRYALEVLNTVLSGQGGRLFLELRDKQSLAYSVSSFYQEALGSGFFGVYIGTDPRKLDQAMTGIRKELERVTTTKITKAELDRAIKYIVGSFEIDLQRNSALAASFGYNELYGLGWDEYQKYTKRVLKVNTDDVLRVAKKYIDLQHPTVSVIRPPAQENAQRPESGDHMGTSQPAAM